jgi:beta-lactamase regulating signal transducer with metallopeptidase domain
MSAFYLHLATAAAEHVLNAIPAGLLIAALAWLFLRIVGRQNSGTRFAVWFGALLGVAGVPLVSFMGKGVPAARTASSEIVLPEFWAAVIFVLWIVIVALAITRIVVGLWRLRRLRTDSVPLLASNLTPAIREIVAQFQSTRRVAVCTSSAVSVPTAIGFFRPAILLPEWVLQELSEEELKVVLLHEFAHLRRWDDWTNLAQKLVRSVFFFHPAVWWIERRLSLEREMACDEVVLAETENPQAYAECLVSLAEKNFVRRGLALAQAVVGRARETSLRLARILDGSQPNSSRVFKPVLGLAAVVTACGVIALPGAPRLIAFGDSTPARVTHAASANKVPTMEIAHQVLNATVIPATFRPVEAPVTTAVTRKSAPAKGVYRPSELGEVRGGKQRQRDVLPVMVRASTQPEVVAPDLLFVMQTTQYDEEGSAIVRLSVWRVTIENDRRTVQQQVFMYLL